MKLQQKPTNVLTKGLITEAGELTFPEGASVDELNCSLERTGSRRRRLGINYEADYTSHTVSGFSAGSVTSTYVWEHPGGVSAKTFVVAQFGSRIHFFDSTSGSSLSSGLKTGSNYIDLNTYKRPTGAGPQDARIQCANLFGHLVVASPEINTILVSYNSDTDTISAEEIEFRYRDFSWRGDRSSYEDGVATGSVTIERKYDTQNSGWKGDKGAAALSTYISSESEYPPLTHAWYAGKNSSGLFSVAEWQKVYSGSSLIANGSYILDLYAGDRVTVSGIAGLTNATESTRFSTVVSYASRIFYAGMTSTRNTSNIYFSKICSYMSDIGECFQQNDPTAEDFSDLLDDDGGVINIPEASNIRRLHVLGPYLVVFAENGVWAIRGVDDVFKATGYAVNKISDVGLFYDTSFVSAEGRPYWWASSGIFTLTVSEEGGSLKAINLSLPTIQSFWENISPSAKAQCKGVFDSLNGRVFWMYPSEGFTTDYKMNRILILDEPLQAFYPWAISNTVTGYPYVTDALYLRGSQSSSVSTEVVDSSGTPIVDSSSDAVIITRTGSAYSSTSLVFLTVDTSDKVTFSIFSDDSFKDWGSADYSSYMVTSYDFMGDLTTKKNLLYTTVYLKRTEEGLTGNDVDGYEFGRPSSCLLSSYWNFRTQANSLSQQCYKNGYVVASESGLVYPDTVVSNRLKIRGKGRQMTLKFESEEGKDFHLLGFDVISNSKGRV